MLLYIIRHGDPIYNPDSLTEKGVLQAKALAKRLAVNGLDKIFVSPMVRARQTAQPTCELLNIKPEIAEWTSEDLAYRDFSYTDESLENGTDWSFNYPKNNQKTPEILALGDRWYEAEPFCRTKVREGYIRIQQESDKFTEMLGYKRERTLYRILRPSDERVAVFCHSGFGTVWLSYLLSIHPVLFWSSFGLNHSSITVLEFKNTESGMTAPYCLTLSDTSHLYADGLPLEFCNEIKI